jgi:flagellar hook-associated protein 3 FlgL
MIRRLDAATDSFLTNLASISRRIDQAQREITSGRRINRVSDEPDELSHLLQLRTELTLTEQLHSNLGRVTSEVDAAEQSLQSAVEVLDRVAVLGMQGASGIAAPEQRGMIAVEVENLLEQMVGLSRTRIETRYIFSGNADEQPPFTIDVTLDDPVSDYLGDPAARQVMHPAGTLFSVSKSADGIFDHPDAGKNVFQAINNLRLSLRANDDAGIEAALGQIQSAGAHLADQLANFGAAQNQVAEATNFAFKQELRIKTQLGTVEDADATGAILALNEARYQQEVALATKAKNTRRTLFDYLG